MAMQFHRAERRKAKLRLALAGPAGSGKTYSALLIAFGLGGRTAMIDTERGSGDLYAHLGNYDVCSLDAPFTPEKYIEAIRAAESAGYDTIIIDSLSHAWAGPGGVLDIQGHAADKSGNSWTAWRQVTPRHNDLVDAILLSKCHIIASIRSKMDHVQTVENGKTVVKKVGMNPIQRDGMEYEFTVFMDLDLSHTASASKDRTMLFDGQVFKPTPETGRMLKEWLEAGVENTLPEKSAKLFGVPAGSRDGRAGQDAAGAQHGQAQGEGMQSPPQQSRPQVSTPVSTTQKLASQGQGSGNKATDRQIAAARGCINRAAQAEGCQLTHSDQAFQTAVLSAVGSSAASLEGLTGREASYIIDNAPGIVRQAVEFLDLNRGGQLPPWMVPADGAGQGAGTVNGNGRRRLF
jgi:hypothetical protein